MSAYDRTENALRDAIARAERAESTIRAMYHEQVTRESQQRQAIAEAHERSKNVERLKAYDAEVQETRKASWLRWHTLPGANMTNLAANNFSPAYIADNTPSDPAAWPPDDAPENHIYHYAVADVEEPPALQPSLVLKARALGLPGV